MTLMEFDLFIVPITMIVTQLGKQYIPSQHIPIFAISFGLVAGIAYGAYYGQDLFVHGFQGLVYGASASGLYDLGKSVFYGEAGE